MALAAVLLLGTTAGWACGDDWPAVAVAEPLRLTPVADAALVKPGGNASVAFLLTNLHGAPVAGARVDFSAVEDPSTPARDLAGATLGASFGSTDANGLAMVTVTGGLPTIFQLTARNPLAGQAQVLVVVSEGDQGTIEVVASPEGGSAAASVVTTVDVLLFDTRACEGLSLSLPPRPVRPVRTVAPGAPAGFAINNMVSSAIVAQGRDGSGKLRAAGCVDLPANTVVAGSTVEIDVTMADLVPAPQGTYAVTSHISFAKSDIAKRVAAPWVDLADCPLDPGQLWLDCAVDALGSPPGDALDCVPAPTGEGELADLITARRGTTVPGSICRSSAMIGGAQALEAKIAGLFPSPAQAPASSLPSLGQAMTTILDQVVLGSTLALDPTAVPNAFQAVHTLRTAVFRVAGLATTVDILAQGAPGAQARFVPVTTHGDTLALDAHGLALHLGSLAHVAFARVAFVGHGYPAATSAYLDQLFSLASSGNGSARKTGCDALDVLVCAQVGRGAGCLRAACVAGQAALAARLDGAFALVDGDGADLQLSGSAVMSDDDGDGIADRLGLSSQDPALWTAQVRAHAGTEIISGSWLGVPQAP